MKLKTINAVIGKKFDKWLASIADENVRALVEKNTICTGGCIASMLLQTDVYDYDFYFRDLATTEAVARYYVAQFKSSNTAKNLPGGHEEMPFDVKVTPGDESKPARVEIYIKSAGVVSESQEDNYQYFEGVDEGASHEYLEKTIGEAQKIAQASTEKPAYRPVYFTSNAITLANDVQVVIRFYGEPEAIHANYDFIHCTNYWTSWERKVTTNKEALESLLAKELRYVGSKYPLCSLVRIRKFIRRNWTITAGQVLKIAMNLQQFNLSDLNVLQDQLTGVDVAYFHDIIEKLKEKDPTKVDTNYLLEIIDRMF